MVSLTIINTITVHQDIKGLWNVFITCMNSDSLSNHIDQNIQKEKIALKKL